MSDTHAQLLCIVDMLRSFSFLCGCDQAGCNYLPSGVTHASIIFLTRSFLEPPILETSILSTKFKTKSFFKYPQNEFTRNFLKKCLE